MKRNLCRKLEKIKYCFPEIFFWNAIFKLTLSYNQKLKDINSKAKFFKYFYTYDLVWVEQGIGVEGETGVAGPILPSWWNKNASLLNNTRCPNKHKSWVSNLRSSL